MKDGRMRRWLRDWAFVAVDTAASLGSLLLFCIGLVLLPLMLITGGVLLLPQFVRILHRWSDVNRRRVGRYRGEDIPSPGGTLHRGATIDERLRFSFSPAAGREALWLTVHALPMMFVSIVTIALPIGVVQSLAIPFYWQLAPADEPIVFAFPVTSWQSAALMPLVGVIYGLISWALIPAIARLFSLISARMLTAPRRSLLAERVDALTLSRAAALDAHGAELRRIERDLHDGAQNRLVNVVMMLGIAERALETGATDAVEQVRRAQDAATDALAGLRRTVHDIYPPILDELGLEGALASLAGRSAVPCTLESSDVGRVPAAVESASYFVVAEALTNVNKYSDAASASVRVRRDGDLLEITVTDDGGGGAIERPGGGLAGIRRRIEAFEGTMDLTSPAGGPTTLRAEMLCGS
ncbi:MULTISPECIES: sensor domain-containing protein [unclassified Microbacterium]|uniref:sensor histidine kinase n=1 Tax=unclassified Microbacterium TaxID=2609290 RepID=UPI001CBB8B1B|nr:MULTISPECIES: sensor domain-containing protein [unclassified Microbacterium]